MRLPLIAALVAVASLSAPSHAAQPGAGAVALEGTSFFRPQNGVAVAGVCTYIGNVLAGVAASVTVPPGNNEYTTITCEIRDAQGAIDSGTDSGVEVAVMTRAPQPIGGRTPTAICGTVRAKATTWVGEAFGTSCAPVLPGNLK